MTERPVRTEMPHVSQSETAQFDKVKHANHFELSVVNKFRREIWTKFLKGIKEYELIQPGDKIAVCISGGNVYLKTKTGFYAGQFFIMRYENRAPEMLRCPF